MPRKIWINIPAYSGTMHLETAVSLFPEMVALAVRGDEVELRSELGSPYICDARGIMVQKFLESDADTFVFIDHDVSWDAGALVRLIDAPVDCRAGVYRMRKDELEWPLRWDETRPELQADPVTGLLAVWGVPAGFLVLSRAMLEKMAEHYRADLAVASDDVEQGSYCALFSDYWIKREDGPPVKMLDDYALCWRWRDMGGQVWIDPDITFGHTGNKTFEGNLAQWLLARP